MRDFTLDMYGKLCSTIINSGYTVLTLKGYLQSPIHPEKLVILRHDVDRQPATALNMAKLEKELKISSTYYFRKKRDVFVPHIIKSIADLGHEIGYHYETLADAGGDDQKALDIFGRELKEFRKICDVATISMHGSPLSKWNNLDLWRKYGFMDFGIIGEAYLSLDYTDLAYMSDTGRTWERERHNIRDVVPQSRDFNIPTTADLIELIQTGRIGHLCLLVHPNRWSDSLPAYCQAAFYDFIFNLGKAVIKMVRTEQNQQGKDAE
jgi:hypothetical protein